MDENRINDAWNQKTIPVLYRRGAPEPLLARLPQGDGALEINKVRNWLRRPRGHEPTWNDEKRYWQVPRTWFKHLPQQCVERFGSVYIIQPFREKEVCARACWEATGEECNCSCMGEHHGSQQPNGSWKEVSDAFAVQWNGRHLACRLLTMRTV